MPILCRWYPAARSGETPPGRTPVREGTALPDAAGALRRPDREPPPRPRRALCAAGEGSTPSAPPGTRATPPSPPRCGPPTRRCCTTARAASSCARAAAGRPAATRVRDVLLGVVAAPPTSPSRVGGTRFSARLTLPSFRRRRPSRRTCREQSGSRSRSRGPRTRSGVPVAATTPSPCAVSATRRSTTPPRSAPSTPRCLGAISACRCRCCWSARTTGSASAYRTPRGMDRGNATATGPGYGISRPTAAMCAATFDAAAAAAAWARRPAPGVPAPAHRAVDGTCGADYETAYRRPEEIAADSTAIRCSTARLLVGHGVLTPAQPCSPATRPSAPCRRRRDGAAAAGSQPPRAR